MSRENIKIPTYRKEITDAIETFCKTTEEQNKAFEVIDNYVRNRQEPQADTPQSAKIVLGLVRPLLELQRLDEEEENK